MSTKLHRFPVTDDQIARVMDIFYARIRVHPDLGPVFNGHIGTSDAEWDDHIALITRFWRNALLGEGGYDGNPMRVHVTSPDITPALFDPWLALFGQVLDGELPPEAATPWLALATRIGASFRMAMGETPKNGIPNLR